jgi:hypothetical protein
MAGSVEIDGITPGFSDSVDIDVESTPGAAQDIISEAVPTGEKWYLRNLQLNYSLQCEYSIYKDLEFIGSGKTGSGQFESFFKFSPPRPILASEVIRVEVTPNSTMIAKPRIKAHLQFSRQTL